MSTNKSKVAVIGLGNIGKVVASNLVKGNREVIVASHKLEDAKALAQKLGQSCKSCRCNSCHCKRQTLLSCPFGLALSKSCSQQYANELQGKIIIDPSNPIAPDGNGGFKKIIGADESAGEILKGLLPNGATLVKALGYTRCCIVSRVLLTKNLKLQYCFMHRMTRVSTVRLRS